MDFLQHHSFTISSVVLFLVVIAISLRMKRKASAKDTRISLLGAVIAVLAAISYRVFYL